MTSVIRIVAAILVLLLLFAVAVALLMRTPGTSYAGELPELTDAQGELAERLRGHVEVLAGEYPDRNYSNPEQYRAAEAYIADQLEGYGYDVSFEDVPDAEGARNVIAERSGNSAPDEVVVVGAHYDSAPSTPGADDNASGVAGALELARRFAKRGNDRTIRFVLFANEEPPWFRSDSMGSRIHAQQAAERGDDIVIMFALEMLGYYADESGSQNYPPGLEYFYPDTGDFIAFVTSTGYRSQLRRTVSTWRKNVPFPSEGLSAPRQVQGVDFSDHAEFWAADYPALMVTDTAFMRNPHYHQQSDTPETLDYDRFARVVDGLEPVVADWATSD
jgi:Zn-dependent M28 family amino/carboxypeptidase